MYYIKNLPIQIFLHQALTIHVTDGTSMKKPVIHIPFMSPDNKKGSHIIILSAAMLFIT